MVLQKDKCFQITLTQKLENIQPGKCKLIPMNTNVKIID